MANEAWGFLPPYSPRSSGYWLDNQQNLGQMRMAPYPGWLRPAPVRVVPVGLVSTAPAQALTGALSGGDLGTAPVATAALLLASSLLFRLEQCRSTSASS